MNTGFLSHLHSTLRASRRHHSELPPEKKSSLGILHKQYPRFKNRTLPQPVITASLLETLRMRRSGSTGTAHRLTDAHLGSLLGAAASVASHPDHQGHRPYPSGGGRYPIEIYLITTEDTSNTPYVAHYHPTNHALELLWPLPDNLEFTALTTGNTTFKYSTLIVLTARWQAQYDKYRDFTYNLALLEAGHIAQNILLCATALSLHARPFCGFDDLSIIDTLDINPSEEQPVYLIALSASNEKL